MKHLLFCLYCFLIFNTGFSQIIYIDPEQGNDSNNGSQQEPVKTLNEGVNRVNLYSGEYDSLVLKLQPGLYVLDKNLTINYNSNFTAENTLTIEAEIMPDDEDWTPEKMPVLLSTSQPENITGEFCTFSLRVETNNAAVRGIKFLSNPYLTTKHFCIYRVDDTLSSLTVSQCMFIGDRDIMPIQVAVMVNGHGTKVDHCVFSSCNWAAIFFYAEGFTVPIRNGSLHHCIITDCNRGAIWTSLVNSDFLFYNNIVNNCPYFWIKNYNNYATYILENCVVTDVNIYNGVSLKSNELGQGDYEFIENNVIRDGDIHLVKWDEDNPFAIDRNFLHISKDSLGYDLDAGIFKKKDEITLVIDDKTTNSEALSELSIFPNPANRSIVIQGQGLSEQTLDYEIFDLMGRKVLKGTIEGNTINISMLGENIYLLTLKIDKEIIGKKLIVK